MFSFYFLERVQNTAPSFYVLHKRCVERFPSQYSRKKRKWRALLFSFLQKDEYRALPSYSLQRVWSGGFFPSVFDTEIGGKVSVCISCKE